MDYGKEVDRDLQQKHLRILIRNGAFQFTETFFPYTSGEVGPYYVQSAVVLKHGRDYRTSIKDMTEFVKRFTDKNIDVISGGESRDWVFSFPTAVKMGLPHMMIYKNQKVIGPDIENKRVAHVADLSNEGSSPRDLWIPTIRGAGGKIDHIFFYVDRLEDGVRVMEDLNLDSHSIVPLNESAWDYLLDKNVIDKEIYSSLRERMDDKDKWAREMLRSKAGLEILTDLLSYIEKKNRAKGEKILNVGYPDMKEELLDRLAKEHGKNFIEGI